MRLAEGIKLFSLLGATALLSACVTPYQPLGLGGGYSDMQLNENTYQVSFSGNGNSSSEYVYKLLLYRAADLTNQNGYKYFMILKGAQNIDSSAYTSPTTVTSAAHSNYNGYGSVHGGRFNYSGYDNRYGSAVINHGQTSIINRYTDTIVIKMLNKQNKYGSAYSAQAIMNSMPNIKSEIGR